jgi:hypothetical protein
MSTTTATISRIVHVLVDPASNNSCDVATAIVSRIWGPPTAGPHGLERQTVNLRVLGDNGAAPEWLTSVSLYSERPTDEQLAAMNPVNPKGYRTVAFWPERA